MRTVAERTDTLNRLRQGELAAAETYQQVLEAFGDEPIGADLRALQAEHRESADALGTFIAERGGEPAESSGIWGMWAKAVEGTAKLFGVAAALRSLKQGEEQGIEDYEDALQDPTLDAESHQLIVSLLPATQAHVSRLECLTREAN